MSDLSIQTLCLDCKADPHYAQSISQHGQTCTIEATGETLSAESINQRCNQLLVGMAKATAQACGLSPAERKAARQKRRADREAQKQHEAELKAQYCTALSQEYQLEITPRMIGMGIFGILIMMFGGIPMLLLCVASVVFEHWLEQELFDNPQVVAMEAA